MSIWSQIKFWVTKQSISCSHAKCLEVIFDASVWVVFYVAIIFTVWAFFFVFLSIGEDQWDALLFEASSQLVASFRPNKGLTQLNFLQSCPVFLVSQQIEQWLDQIIHLKCVVAPAELFKRLFASCVFEAFNQLKPVLFFIHIRAINVEMFECTGLFNQLEKSIHGLVVTEVVVVELKMLQRAI